MRLEGVSRIVQVGIRDFCEEELERIASSGGRVRTFFDVHARGSALAGALARVVRRERSPRCPRRSTSRSTSTGSTRRSARTRARRCRAGLSFHEASALLGAVAQSGRRIVGFDLNEVAPGPDDDEWDANVGARLLYKLIGWTLLSQRLIEPPRLP